MDEFEFEKLPDSQSFLSLGEKPRETGDRNYNKDKNLSPGFQFIETALTEATGD